MDFRRHIEHDEPEISLIPLIDVVLVIIIFLMLTTTFSKVSGLNIDLPDADEVTTEPREGPEEIVVAINAAGETFIDREPVSGSSVSDIAAALGKAVAQDRDDAYVVISADARTEHQRVIDVMRAAQLAGLARITFAVQTEAQ